MKKDCHYFISVVNHVLQHSRSTVWEPLLYSIEKIRLTLCLQIMSWRHIGVQIKLLTLLDSALQRGEWSHPQLYPGESTSLNTQWNDCWSWQPKWTWWQIENLTLTTSLASTHELTQSSTAHVQAISYVSINCKSWKRWLLLSVYYVKMWQLKYIRP